MSFFGTTDFLIEVRKGNVPGHRIDRVISRNPDVGTTAFEDLWNNSGAYIASTANETWEIVSTSANDTLTGTGARRVLVQYLDEDYVERAALVSLNGTTAVEIATDCFRPQLTLVRTVGTTRFNEGKLTVQVSGAGNVKMEVPFITGDRGFSVSQDGHYAVPAGKVGFGLQFIPFVPKNIDGIYRVVFQVEEGPQVIGAELEFYQDTVVQPIASAFRLPEKTNLTFQAKMGTGGASSISTNFAILIVDNPLLVSGLHINGPATVAGDI